MLSDNGQVEESVLVELRLMGLREQIAQALALLKERERLRQIEKGCCETLSILKTKLG